LAHVAHVVHEVFVGGFIILVVPPPWKFRRVRASL
jgi:hypothetical protein